MSGPPSSYLQLSLDKIVLPSRSTRFVQDEHVQKLLDSIMKEGFLPHRGTLLVRSPFPHESVGSGKFVTVDGAHRYTALTKLASQGKFQGEIGATLLDPKILSSASPVEQCLLIGDRENSTARRGTSFLDQVTLGINIVKAQMDMRTQRLASPRPSPSPLCLASSPKISLIRETRNTAWLPSP